MGTRQIRLLLDQLAEQGSPRVEHSYPTGFRLRQCEDPISDDPKDVMAMRVTDDARGIWSVLHTSNFCRVSKLTLKKAYGFKSYETIEIALYHQLGKLPAPKQTHRFCRLLLTNLNSAFRSQARSGSFLLGPPDEA